MGKFKEALKDFQQVVTFMHFNKNYYYWAVGVGFCLVPLLVNFVLYRGIISQFKKYKYHISV